MYSSSESTIAIILRWLASRVILSGLHNFALALLAQAWGELPRASLFSAVDHTALAFEALCCNSRSPNPITGDVAPPEVWHRVQVTIGGWAKVWRLHSQISMSAFQVGRTEESL